MLASAPCSELQAFLDKKLWNAAGRPRSDYVTANLPLNISKCWDGRLKSDPRWGHITPPKSNVNLACSILALPGQLVTNIRASEARTA